MDKSFKTHTRDYFRTFRLSKGQLCRLERLQAGGCARRRPIRFFGMPLARVALAVLLVGAGWWGWQQFQRTGQVNRLVAEIVYNHNKQMAMEIESDAMETVKAYLSKLDFPLIAPHRLPRDQWQLMGGRYCSLQGKLAAQLKLRHLSSGEVFTLFQTVCPPGVPTTATLGRNYVNGVEVQLWSEHGLLLGMAGGR